MITDSTLVGQSPLRAEQVETFAPGWPGRPARWTSSAKSGIGTAVSRDSRVWFTLSHGILNEIYYPRVDHACTRDLGFIVTDGHTYFSEEKRDTQLRRRSQVAPGIPAYRIYNTAADGRYRIEKEILTDPWRDVVLQRVRFVPLQGTLADFHLYVLLAPHLANAGAGNTAWVGDYKGSPMLFAEREHHALALASSAPWLARSVGFVGVSDGWQELHAHKRLDHTYARAENGNVAVTGEIDLVVVRWNVRDRARIRADRDGGRSTRAHHAARGLRRDTRRVRPRMARMARAARRRRPAEAANRASIGSAPRCCGHTNRSAWKAGSSRASRFRGDSRSRTTTSAAITWCGLGISSEIAGGFIAIGAHEHVRRVLRYLQVTQEPDGHWSQNMWLDGRPYWHGVQMDETALPILLVDLAAREGVIDTAGRDALWPMVRRAAVFLARNGPVSPQDRWEEQPGYAPFTVATEIAALLVAADLADASVEHDRGRVSAGDRRRMERQHRAMAVRGGDRTRATARRRGVLRSCRAARPRRCRVAVSGVCPDQEPASGSKRPGRRR